jgi:hypothetical protein
LDVLTPRFKLRLAPFVKPGAAKQHPDGAYLWMLLPTTAVQDVELHRTSRKGTSTHLHKNNGIVTPLCGGGGPYPSAVRQPMVIVHAHSQHDPYVR